MKTVVAFGEILARISPPGHLRLRQALPGSLDFTFGGAEANVAASVALFGGSARLVSALPDHPLADAAIGHYAGLGVDTRQILQSANGRLGLYFYENGVAQRPGEVIYDREHSTVSQTPPDAYSWPAIFSNAGWLYLTGITPGISKTAAQATLAFAEEAQRRSIPIALDLNFRRKLWRWQPGTAPETLARETLLPLIEKATLLIGNDGSALDLFGLGGSGDTLIARSASLAQTLAEKHPNLSLIAMTLRESLSASHNRWGALLYETATGTPHLAPSGNGGYCPYDLLPITDRVGAGDAFGGALIYALSTPELSAPDTAIRFATAASCLAHTIPGDISYLSRSDVEALMHGDGSGRVRR